MSTAPNMKRRMVVMLACVGTLFFLVFGYGVFKNIMIAKFLAGFSNQVQTVATISAATLLVTTLAATMAPTETTPEPAMLKPTERIEESSDALICICPPE